MEQDKARLLSRLTRLCSMREYCSGDIIAKMKDVPSNLAAEVLDTLHSEGYVDDVRYARAFARDKSALQGWGIVKIRVALQRKGIDAATIAGALEEIDGEAASGKLEALLSSKWKSLSSETDPQKKQAKLFRYALGRGYCYDEIKKIYDNIRRT